MGDWYRDHDLSPEASDPDDYRDWAQQMGAHVDLAGNVLWPGDLGHPNTQGDSRCCDLHGRYCEQGGEECCRRCTEALHFAIGHGGVPCSNPDLEPVAIQGADSV